LQHGPVARFRRKNAAGRRNRVFIEIDCNHAPGAQPERGLRKQARAAADVEERLACKIATENARGGHRGCEPIVVDQRRVAFPVLAELEARRAMRGVHFAHFPAGYAGGAIAQPPFAVNAISAAPGARTVRLRTAPDGRVFT
jgi:hypothetical protein